ncbi:MAG: sigma-54-dependent transcriptional regulator [Planctomycetota bacterium]
MADGSGVAHLVAIVESDPAACQHLDTLLRADGYTTRTFSDGAGLLKALPALVPAAVCMDFDAAAGSGDDARDTGQGNGNGGMDLLQRIRRTLPWLPVLVVTDDAEPDRVVEAIREGAYDFLQRPISAPKLAASMRNAVERSAMARRLGQLEREAEGNYPGLIGGSTPMREMFRQMDRVADSDVTVLIRGESGTGKELVARAVHECSPRHDGPFVPLNCAAIPEGLIESELFGHEKGAFTGANEKHTGRFAEASNGTLFLDEIAELALPVQAKLLRVLQERTFRPVGGSKEQQSDFRLIAASHKDLAREVRKGRFREDLFFRVAVFELRVPSLRDRDDDILLLAEHFVELYSGERAKVAGLPMIEPDAADALLSHEWPGNVRELQNAIQHALLVCDRKSIRARDLPPRILEGAPADTVAPRAAPTAPTAPTAEMDPREITRMTTATRRMRLLLPGENEPVVPLAELERRAIAHALRRTDGNVPEAGRLLGIGRSTLYRKVKEYGLG